jgi:hypothetical protein
MALHAKGKAEAGHRFYALYGKISREGRMSMPSAASRPGFCGHRGLRGRAMTSGAGACAQARDLAGQSQSDECLCRRSTADSGRWAFRACGTAISLFVCRAAIRSRLTAGGRWNRTIVPLRALSAGWCAEQHPLVDNLRFLAISMSRVSEISDPQPRRPRRPSRTRVSWLGATTCFYPRRAYAGSGPHRRPYYRPGDRARRDGRHRLRRRKSN